jgi:hypothetical protein
MAFMNSNKKRTRKRVADERIDEIVEKQAIDDSAWEKPIQVTRQSRSSRAVHLKTKRGSGSGRRSHTLASVVVLDPDVADVFADSESVNQALRALAGIIQHQSGKAHP